MNEADIPLYVSYFLLSTLLFVLFLVVQRYGLDAGNVREQIGVTLRRISQLPSANYTKTEIPFSIVLRDIVTADLINGVEFDIRCTAECKLFMLFGVNTNLLARITMGAGLFTTSSPTVEDVFIEQSLEHSGPIELEPNSTHRLLAVPSRDFSLGHPPRSKVPLVLLCTLTDYSECADCDITSLVTVIHIKDEFCTDVTSKLNEVVNLSNGRWIPLYKYYSTGSNGDTDRCLVCRDNEVSRILLPCRHACLCETCLPHLSDRCPMCRTVVMSSAVI